MTMRQRLAHIALGGVLVLSGMIASSFLQTADSQQSHTEIVKAREFHVVDESGATTAVIASHPSGMAIQNAAGKTAAIVAAGPNGGKLALNNVAGDAMVKIEAGPNGGNLRINNAAGTPIAFIATSFPPGGGSLFLRNAAGKDAVQISASSHGGGLQINNAAGKPAAEINALSAGGGRLSINNNAGEGVAAIQSGGIDGGGMIHTQGMNGSSALIAGSSVGVYVDDKSGGNTSINVKRPRVSMGIDEDGNGFVRTRDKKGDPKK